MAEQNNPTEHLLRAEIFEQIQRLLECLSMKERHVFKLYFFAGFSANDIAMHLHTDKSNIYNLLSRAKRKVQKERIIVSIDQYVIERKRINKKQTNILRTPPKTYS
ncbi:hypothetical protein AB990_06420 [Alkalihalobacillus pseudalcaliphilus]|nr:hypothetical protein AB990_06420 [Alkalihalobacillus pseudalcaliphilus]